MVSSVTCSLDPQPNGKQRVSSIRGLTEDKVDITAQTNRLDEIGARPSIGTIADSFDNALAETTNGLYKSECVYGPDTRRLGRRR